MRVASLATYTCSESDPKVDAIAVDSEKMSAKKGLESQ